MTCGIYKITNVVNGKVYIGQSQNIEKRWRSHKKSIRCSNQVLYRSMRKYGVNNFIFDIVQICDVADLDELEIYYIKKYNSYIHFENSNGMNMTLGGDKGTRGYKYPKEVTEKIRRKLTGRKLTENQINHLRIINKKGGNPNSKICYCDGIKFLCMMDCADYLNISISLLSEILSKNKPMPKYLYDKELHLQSARMDEYTYYEDVSVICDGNEFESINQCAMFYGINTSTMGSWLKGKYAMPVFWYDKGLRLSSRTMCEYKVRSENESSDSCEVVVENNSVKVFCNGVIYDTATDCARFYNEEPRNVRNWLNGVRKMPQKFIDLNLHYTDDMNRIYDAQTEKTKKKAIIIDDTLFNSISNGAKYLGINSRTLSGFLNNECKTPQKYIDMGLRYATQKEIDQYIESKKVNKIL